MANYTGPVCAICKVRACSAEPGTKQYPSYCPVPVEAELLRQVEQAYLEEPELRRLALESARTESAGYCVTTRIEDIMDFARRIGADEFDGHEFSQVNVVDLVKVVFADRGAQEYERLAVFKAQVKGLDPLGIRAG